MVTLDAYRVGTGAFFPISTWFHSFSRRIAREHVLRISLKEGKMDINAMFDVLERLIDKSKVAVLANMDAQATPRLRWMTPALIRGRDGFLYALTAPDFAKTAQLKQHPEVEWMIQGPGLQEILRVRGKALLVDNPALKADVLEALGGRLGTFWKKNPDPSNMVVLETVIEECCYSKPMTDESFTATVR